MSAALILNYLSARAARYPRETPPGVTRLENGMYVIQIPGRAGRRMLLESEMIEAVRNYRAMARERA